MQKVINPEKESPVMPEQEKSKYSGWAIRIKPGGRITDKYTGTIYINENEIHSARIVVLTPKDKKPGTKQEEKESA